MAKPSPRETTLQRLTAVRRHLDSQRINTLLVTFPPHVRYLTRFSGSNACCVITAQTAAFFTDGRYKTQAREEVVGYRVYIAAGTLFQEIRNRRIISRAGRVGFNPTTLRIAELESLKALFPSVRFSKVKNILDDLAAVKDVTEIARIRKAVSVSDEVFRSVLPLLKPGISELDIAAEIVYQHRRRGAEADAFEPIVASGPRGAFPHARATRKRVARGEFVTMDFGCRVEGYHSDLTRTVSVGKPGIRQRKIYQAVLEAQQLAVEAARAGMRAADLDAVARKSISRAGFARYFPHSLGHGLGLQVHENPRLSALSKDVLREGNVVTIEPGVYVPGVGGVRIEDDVVIRNRHAEVLTTSPK
ncbi:MAG: aminopeptidase P family protein, partial [Ignavibacteriales bacterium]|nr:aminopeptidase P family protein [Ignavibacteriales bacterium]